jgi:hypothetical protein
LNPTRVLLRLTWLNVAKPLAGRMAPRAATSPSCFRPMPRRSKRGTLVVGRGVAEDSLARALPHNLVPARGGCGCELLAAHGRSSRARGALADGRSVLRQKPHCAAGAKAVLGVIPTRRSTVCRGRHSESSRLHGDAMSTLWAAGVRLLRNSEAGGVRARESITK